MESILTKGYNMFSVSKYNRNEFLTPFDSLFDSFISQSFPDVSSNLGENFFSKGSFPKVDIIEEKDKLIIWSEISDRKREEVSVELDGDVL